MKRSGLALVEILIALGLLAGVAVALSRMLSTSATSGQSSLDQALASQMAQNSLERYSSLPVAELSSTLGGGVDLAQPGAGEFLAPAASSGESSFAARLTEHKIRFYTDPSKRGSGYLQASLRWKSASRGEQGLTVGRVVSDGPAAVIASAEPAAGSPESKALLSPATSNRPSGSAGAQEARAGLSPQWPIESSAVDSALEGLHEASAHLEDREYQTRKSMELAGLSRLPEKAGARSTTEPPSLAGPASTREGASSGFLAAGALRPVPDGSYSYVFREERLALSSSLPLRAVVYTLSSTGGADYPLVRSEGGVHALIEGQPIAEESDYAVPRRPGRPDRILHACVTERRLYLQEEDPADPDAPSGFALVMTLETLPPGFPAEDRARRLTRLLDSCEPGWRRAATDEDARRSRLALGW